MSCWVVPAIAAELWGVTIDRVLAGILNGTIDSRTENGFVFVDVSLDGQTFSARIPGVPPPPTYVVIERDADDIFPTLYDQASVSAPQVPLLTGLGAASTAFDDIAWLHAMADQILIGGDVNDDNSEADESAGTMTDDPELPSLDDEEDAIPLPPRQAMRAAVGRLRKPPPRPQVEA